MSLCVLAGGKALALAIDAFTLSWTHSVERVVWEEDWRVTPAGLEIVRARIKGSGAGMEPPPDAVRDGPWWSYTPALPPLPELVLAASGATGSGWRLCSASGCRVVGSAAGDPTRLRACD